MTTLTDAGPELQVSTAPILAGAIRQLWFGLAAHENEFFEDELPEPVADAVLIIGQPLPRSARYIAAIRAIEAHPSQWTPDRWAEVEAEHVALEWHALACRYGVVIFTTAAGADLELARDLVAESFSELLPIDPPPDAAELIEAGLLAVPVHDLDTDEIHPQQLDTIRPASFLDFIVGELFNAVGPRFSWRQTDPDDEVREIIQPRRYTGPPLDPAEIVERSGYGNPHRAGEWIAAIMHDAGMSRVAAARWLSGQVTDIETRRCKLEHVRDGRCDVGSVIHERLVHALALARKPSLRCWQWRAAA